jgi:hypothetical protein
MPTIGGLALRSYSEAERQHLRAISGAHLGKGGLAERSADEPGDGLGV